MCFHSQQSKDAQALEKRFKAKVKAGVNIAPATYNGFTHPHTPVIAHQQADSIQLFQWGLIPAWAKDPSIQQYTLNAKVETLHQKPSFQQITQQRCLVLADGFMEWQWLDTKGKRKQAYTISLPQQAAFAFAGLWSEWLDPSTGELVHSYSILTTEAIGLMAAIHNSKKRMPIILSAEQEADWLSGLAAHHFSHNELPLLAEKVPELQGALF